MKINEFRLFGVDSKDRKAKAKILFRIQRIEEHGNFGDCESIGSGLRELKIHYAKGYRVYMKEQRGTITLLLNGGDKSTQQKDIEKAKLLWDKYKKD